MTDPRDLGGEIAGPGGPYDKDAVVVDLTNAVLVDGTQVVMFTPSRGGVEAQEPAIAMILSGKINHSPDRAEVMFVFDFDGAAAIISELIGVASRMGPEALAAIMVRIEEVPK